MLQKHKLSSVNITAIFSSPVIAYIMITISQFNDPKTVKRTIHFPSVVHH